MQAADTIPRHGGGSAERPEEGHPAAVTAAAASPSCSSESPMKELPQEYDLFNEEPARPREQAVRSLSMVSERPLGQAETEHSHGA